MLQKRSHGIHLLFIVHGVFWFFSLVSRLSSLVSRTYVRTYVQYCRTSSEEERRKRGFISGGYLGDNL